MKITVRYDEFSVQAVRMGKCPGCGKRSRRQHTFTATVNPYNRVIDPDGTTRPRTPSEVQAKLHEQASGWAPESEVFRHAGC
jgi:hypothetical protein